MKFYERKALNHFQQVGVSVDEPLKNVKAALGALRHVEGNPLTKTEISLQLSINYFVNQVPIGIAALPLQLQTSFPAFIFGLTDFYSGYSKALKLVQLNNPWQTLDNIAYHVGDEMIDQAPLTGWIQPAYWDVIQANWLPNPILGNIAINPLGAPGNIVKNNFWIPGHKYHIKIRIDDTLNINLGLIDLPFDGIVLHNFYETVVNNGVYEYDYVPQSTDLYMRAQACPAGPPVISSMSIKEIFGYDFYSSEPSIGVYGYNKNVALSPNVVRGDVVITYIAPILNFRTKFNLTREFYYDYYTAEIVIHCNNVDYGTFLNSFVSDLITLDTIRYIVPVANINQLINPVIFATQTLFGKLATDNIDPRIYITNKDFQPQISDIPINLPIDKSIILGFNIDFNCQQLSLILFVKKVEALTHKR